MGGSAIGWRNTAFFIGAFFIVLFTLVLFSANTHALSSGTPKLKTCTDTDGLNYYKYGITTYALTTGTESKPDLCLTTTVKEYYCGTSSIAYVAATDDSTVNAVKPETGDSSGDLASETVDESSGSGTTADPLPATTRPDLNLTPFKLFNCPLSCAGGRCLRYSPGVDVEATTSWGTPNNLRVHCYASSIYDVQDANIYIQGYDPYGRLYFNKKVYVDCQYPYCNIEKIYSAAEIAKALPGRWVVNCEVRDMVGNFTNASIEMNRTCSNACADVTPPYIEKFNMTSPRTNFVWLDFNGTDWSSGISKMNLVVYYKPTGNPAYGIYSNETKLCAISGCTYYKVMRGTGMWIANATLYDNSGNIEKKEIRFTN